MLGELLARQTLEVGQFGKRHIHAERAGAYAPAFHALAEIRRKHARVHQFQVEQLRIEVGDDRAAAKHFTVLGNRPHRLPLLDQDFLYRRVEANFNAVRGSGFRHGLRDRAHAADGVSPDTLLTVHFPEAVMQEHISGARRIGARVVADDAVEAVHGLDRIALEPAIEKIARGIREEIEQRALSPETELAQAVGERTCADQFGNGGERAAFDDVRRRLQHEFAQDIRHEIQFGGIVVEFCRVLRREFRDFFCRPACSGLEIAPVG